MFQLNATPLTWEYMVGLKTFILKISEVTEVCNSMLSLNFYIKNSIPLQ